MTVIYSTTSSLDGYIAGPGGDLEWSVPSEELHRFHNEQTRELGAHLLGRRLYETMRYWDTPKATASESPVIREFAEIWRALPKVVLSRTLTQVEGENIRLAQGTLAEELAALSATTDRDIGIGGATLAAQATDLGLIDEYRLFLSPALLGGGTPYLPGATAQLTLELVETRTFGGRVAYLRYRQPR